MMIDDEFAHRVITTTIDGSYHATLYDQSFDEDGSLCLEFLRSVTMDRYGRLEIRRSNGLVLLSDVAELNRALATYIHNDLRKKWYWLSQENHLHCADSQYRLEVYAFFMEHPHFNSFDWFRIRTFIKQASSTLLKKFVHLQDFSDFIRFVGGTHTSKSVRKALFKSYEEAIIGNMEYNPTADMIICRSFDDPNLVSFLLGSPARKAIFVDLEMTDVIRFLRWLQKKYSAAAIVKSLSNSVAYHGSFYTPIWNNTFRMASTLYQEYSNAMRIYYSKVPLSAKWVHDELVRVYSRVKRKAEMSVQYHYSAIELSFEMKIGRLDFKLVKNKFELTIWGDMMHNCLFGFNKSILSKESYILGVFENEQLTYAVEFDGKNIKQAYGKYNAQIPIEDNISIYQWAGKAKKIFKSASN